MRVQVPSLTLEGMMTKHTPGPWKVHDRWYVGQDKDGSGTHAEVKCCVGVPSDREDEHEANARLIAAAPDLLAMLEEELQDRQCMINCDGPHADCHCWWCRAKRVAFKATGVVP